MNSFDIFNIIITPLILLIGLIGNTIGYIVMKRPKLVQIGPRNMCRYLFMMDSIYLLQFIVTFLNGSLRIDLSIISNIVCRLWYYINYSFATFSPMFLVYISIDRFISIKWSTKRFILRKRNYQLIYVMFIIAVNLLYYLPIVYGYVVMDNYSMNDISNYTTICTFKDLDSQLLISYMDLANRVLMPFILIMIFSFFLTIEIFKSRRRILDNFHIEENRYYFNEIRLSITSLCLNMIYVVLQLPVSVYVLFSDDYTDSLYLFTYYLFYFSYGINFYVFCFSNSLFRRETVSFIRNLNFFKN